MSLHALRYAFAALSAGLIVFGYAVAGLAAGTLGSVLYTGAAFSVRQSLTMMAAGAALGAVFGFRRALQEDAK